MRYLAVALILLFSFSVYGQDDLPRIQTPSLMNFEVQEDLHFVEPSEDFLNFPTNVKLMALASSDGYFHKTYAVDPEGEALSSGYMPSPYFKPNNNFIVITGKQQIHRDSFNPYGADDLPSLIFFGTVNNFISRLRINRR